MEKVYSALSDFKKLHPGAFLPKYKRDNKIHGKSIKEITEYLFDIKYWSDKYDESEEERWQNVEQLMRDYPWNNIFNEWNLYLHTNCPTSDDVINFMNLFLAYEGHKQIIPDPIDFAAYLYYRLGDRIKESEAQTMADSIIISVLQHSGLLSKYDTCCAPESDPRIIAAVEDIKNGSKQ